MKEFQLKLPNLTGINRGVHVLVVEDDDVYGGMIESMLGDDKRVETVSRAHDGVEGEELLAREPWPDLVITDLSMPKQGGLDFLRAARETETAKRLAERPQRSRSWTSDENARLPIVVMTSSSEALDFQSMLKAEGNAFITKPRESGELRQMLRELVRSVIRGEALPTILTMDELTARKNQRAET